MSASTTDAVALDASLHLLADDLLTALVVEDVAPSILEVATPDRIGFDLRLCALEGVHPSALLLGHVASPDAHALGIATTGHAFRLADADGPAERTPVHLVTIVTRSGELVHRIRFEQPGRIDVADDDLPVGEQIDLLRRCLQLSTEPPPVPASTYWSIQWLSRMLEAGSETTRIVDALALHPAMTLLRSVPTRDAADVIDAFHRVCDWTRIARLASTGSLPLPDLSPTDVDWLDEGALARWLLNRSPPLETLRRLLPSAVNAETADAVLGLLADLGVAGVDWPGRRP